MKNLSRFDAESEETGGLEESGLEQDLEKIKKIKQRFLQYYYRRLLKLNTRIRNVIHEQGFKYLGEEKEEIIKSTFSRLIEVMEGELRKIQVAVNCSGLNKVAGNKKIIKDVFQYFTPILDLYKEFEEFMQRYPEFAEKLVMTKQEFLNLRNVLNNIIKNTSEEIVNKKLTKD